MADIERPKPGTKPSAAHQSLRLVKIKIIKRPDLDRFKPTKGKIFDLSPPSPITHPNSADRSSSQSSQSSHSRPHPQSPPIPSKQHRSQSSSRSIKKALASSTSKFEKRRPSSSKSNKRRRSRCSTDESPDPDQDSDINDLALSDFSEPETKLRDRESESSRRFAKLRRARKRTSKKRLLNKEILSKRIVPDSDEEATTNNKHHSIGENNRRGSNDSVTTDDETDTDSDCSASSSSDCSSETDKEEIRRKDQEFIVDDMATEAQKLRVKRQIDHNMPSKFRISKKDNLDHFKTFCEYLVYHCILPQVRWRRLEAPFDESCKHLDSFFTARGVTPLESSAWVLNFRKELKNRPFITELIHSKGGTGCGACNNSTKLSKKIVRFAGPEYSTYTLNPTKGNSPTRRIRSSNSKFESSDSDESSSSFGESIEEDIKHRVILDNLVSYGPQSTEFICGEDCAKRAIDYHFFRHWQINALKSIKPQVQKVLDDKKNQIQLRKFKYSDEVPNKKRLKLYRREIRRIINLIEQDRSSVNAIGHFDSLFRTFLSRLNLIHKSYSAIA